VGVLRCESRSTLKWAKQQAVVRKNSRPWYCNSLISTGHTWKVSEDFQTLIYTDNHKNMRFTWIWVGSAKSVSSGKTLRKNAFSGIVFAWQTLEVEGIKEINTHVFVWNLPWMLSWCEKMRCLTLTPSLKQGRMKLPRKVHYSHVTKLSFKTKCELLYVAWVCRSADNFTALK